MNRQSIFRASNSHSALLSTLVWSKGNQHEHARKENNGFFPRALALAKQMAS